MKTKDNIIKLKECEHDGQICIECGTSFFKAITQARADERKKVLAEITEIKDLKQSEKGKSLDYWEGYTSAVVKMVKKL